MERRLVNPWTWQDNYGYSQAVEVTGGQRVLYCAGQTSMTAEGQPAHEGDMAAQLTLAMDNLEAVLRQAGLSLSNVVRFNIYTTDVDRFFDSYGDVVVARLQRAGCQPAATLLGVARLAFPELLVELEATAVA